MISAKRNWTAVALAVLLMGAVWCERGRSEPPVAGPPSKPPAVEPSPDAAGAVQGIVIESDRPQPYLGVVLLAPNGSEVASTRTGDRGTFLFQQVSAGRYTVVCRKEESSGPAVGTVRVAVQPSRVQAVTVRLAHFPKP
jgi:hypothetical protein